MSAELIERVEKATGPGDPCIRGTDFQDAIARELFGSRFTVEDAGQVRDAFASIDAALSLVERKLPGWEWNVSGGSGPLGWAQLKRWDIVHSCVGNTPALAICLALLKAVKAQAAPERDGQ